ncbi:peptide chain release factor N(5)-glutamine methyltransferase [Abyssalbus ytuae]|uniref:Release factor glutamine methyltransferase n=1 Tax=Abyssalbus ytuae TaxID=2926907 RepID=A0A9E6ZN07_9FLAO|nr:peptide chain release factor N(5)-glutamine methyltransferase [Abyssalbus ytuae]UOB17689.1 peptide chain release factor N(5)-glutamine methyltransferase [Abyssalbus ytuae]
MCYTELTATYNKEEVESFFRLLSEEYLGLKPHQFILNKDTEIEKQIEKQFQDAIIQLKKEKPIQQIIGKAPFSGLDFIVNNHVLIPRPETEELVNLIIREQRKSPLTGSKILDIGTGSGCIAVSLAKKIQTARVYAIDISDEALKLAKKNAAINNVQVEFFKMDILNTEELPDFFDIIVSNPPYVRKKEKCEMKNNVVNYEPHLALFVEDDDPLIFYDKIAVLATKNLKKGGKIYFEINQYLGEETKNLLEKLNFKDVEVIKDVYDNNRIIKGTKI